MPLAFPVIRVVVVLLSISPPLLGATQTRPSDTLAEMAAAYRAYGLPVPPDDARLVRFDSSVTLWHADGQGPAEPEQLRHLGFLLKPALDGQPPELLVGTEKSRPKSDVHIEVIEPKAAAASAVVRTYNDGHYTVNVGLATAIQCELRGWHDLAEALFHRSMKLSSGSPINPFEEPERVSPKVALSRLAWVHCCIGLTRPDEDLAAIGRRMRALLVRETALNSAANQSLVRSLEASLRPRNSKPGSIEAMIDDLTVGRHKGSYAQLVELGFEAVPVFIEHLDDERLTRQIRPAYYDRPAYHERISDVVRGLVDGLADENLGHEERGQYIFTKAEAQAWWAKAQQIGEEKYMVERALPAGEKWWPRDQMLRVVARKYPWNLERLYRDLLGRSAPNGQSNAVARIVAASALAKEAKVKLLAEGGRHADLKHRWPALEELRSLDSEMFVDLLVRTLDSLPTTPKERYWSCDEARFSRLVIETDDPRAWRALLQAAKRADMGLRMEYMNCMTAPPISEEQRKFRVAFLANFLNDDALRDTEGGPMFEGPCAGFTIRRLEVRNLAAMRVAQILGIKGDPTDKWTDEQWAELRRAVNHR